MSNTPYRSRLARQENKRFAFQTLLITFVTIILLIGLIIFGLPSLIKLAIFLGDLKNASSPIEKSDAIAPPPPQLNIPVESTSSANLSLSGYAETESTVTLFLNGNKEDETISDSQGQFSFLNLTLNPGNNQFYVIAADKAGNTSAPSTTYTTSLDNTPPEITIDSPTDNAKFFSRLQQSVSVTGQTEANANLKVNDRIIVVTSDGRFSTQYLLSEGDNTLNFTVIDKAGNKTEKSIKVTYSP